MCDQILSKWDVVGRIGGASWTARVLQDVPVRGCEVGNYFDLAPNEATVYSVVLFIVSKGKEWSAKAFYTTNSKSIYP